MAVTVTGKAVNGCKRTGKDRKVHGCNRLNCGEFHLEEVNKISRVVHTIRAILVEWDFDPSYEHSGLVLHIFSAVFDENTNGPNFVDEF
jgi:hypothetical protein